MCSPPILLEKSIQVGKELESLESMDMILQIYMNLLTASNLRYGKFNYSVIKIILTSAVIFIAFRSV